MRFASFSRFPFLGFAAAVCVVVAFAQRGFCQSAPPPTYYDAAIGKTGAALKSSLHEIIKGQTVIPYTSSATDTWDAIMALDEDPLDSANVVLIYSGLTNLKTNNYTGGVGAGKWDREHVWPQSFGLVAISASSRAKTDLFNLRAIDYTANSTRGNLYYDVTTTPYRTTASAPGSSYDTDSWEPRDADKGVVARAAFYMATRYDGADADVPDLELSETPDAATYHFGKLATLLAWNRRFPPTSGEQARNQKVFTDYQHNRNPFIDRADFADSVFLGVMPEQAWASLRFSPQELLSPAISGDTTDPDGDGLANLLEYVFATDPRQSNSAAVITASAAIVGNVRYIDLNFPHNRYASDVSFSYESSADCASWVTAAAEFVTASVTDFETEQWTVRIPAGTISFFVRAKVSKTF
jgi:endonuclease I